MSTIRRIYAYLLAFAGLALLSVAVAVLAQLLIDIVLGAPLARTDSYVRDTVSFWAAAALVGLPVWLLHWLWIQRTARSDASEHSSPLRGLYLYTVLMGATIFVAIALTQMLRTAFAAVLGDSPAPSDPLADFLARPLPFALVAAGVWLAHWHIAAGDRQLVGESPGTATLRRWYLYGAALVGLLAMLSSAQASLETLWRIVSGAGDPVFAPVLSVSLAGPLAATLVGLGVWLLHWVRLPRHLPEAVRRVDGTAILRSVYLFGVLAVCVAGTLYGASQLLYYAVGRLLGVERPGGVGGNLLQAAAEPASVLLVYGAAWGYQRLAVRQQAANLSEAPRQTGIRRLYDYLVSLVALAVLAVGVTGLLWTLADVLVAPDTLSGPSWREQVALFATLAAIGLPVWLLHWRPSPRTIDESRSLARRLYVYVSLIGAMLSLIGSVAGALYRLIGLALGDASGADVTSDLAHAIAVATVAGLLAAYHWRVVRTDNSRQPLPTPSLGVPAPRPALVLVEIDASDTASLSRALAALLATGVQVTFRPAQV